MQALGERMVSVQWGPWREVGMAAQKGTVQRLKAQGLGSIGNVASWLLKQHFQRLAATVVSACSSRVYSIPDCLIVTQTLKPWQA